MCRCGDSTFNALGSDVFTPGRFRLAVDWERFDKESGTVERDEEVENRLTATASYSFGERVTVVVRLPWSARRLGTTSTSALSDPELTGLFRIWAAPFAPGMGRRAWVSLVAGVKTPWGSNDVTEDGVRLDEHVKPGTGSTDLFGGVSAVFLIDPVSSLFASAQYRGTGTNDHGYRYGNVTLANAAYERKLSDAVDGVVELNYRHAQQDRVDDSGALEPDTGGDVLYVTPRVIVDLGRGVIARALVQIPVVRSLYGEQTEKVVVSAGLTFLF
jgi:hypothetical protein